MAQQRLPSPAIPVEPFTAILDASRSHTVVALGEGLRGNEQGHTFRLSLIRDPKFAATFTDIVVEFGTARYQDVMDRFVRGELVPEDQLRKVWQDTTQNTAVWDRPIYEEFFRTVRALNASRPEHQQLRVLLGDPPIDWERVLSGTDDVGRWVRARDDYAADLIRREVVEKQRRALVIYGDAHFVRGGESIVSLLERTGATSVFTIAVAMSSRLADLIALQSDVASWRIPSLATVRGTVLEARQLEYYDAVLYLGPSSAITFSRLSPALCSDREYMAMRLRRMAVTLGFQEQDQLKYECTNVERK